MSNEVVTSEGYAGPKESVKERQKKVDKLNLSFLDLFDTSKPWVLVENGSILGYFDWVPLKLRVGPWSPMAPVILFVMVYCGLCGNIVAFQQPQQVPYSSEYPKYQSGLWYYNILCFFWTTGISVTVLTGPASYRAWSTFTMWSWSILQLRHGLAALAPWLHTTSFLFQVLELSRFPMLIMHSLTFIVWNFVLMPFVYFLMDSSQKRKNFLTYFTRFRLIQLHVFNILYAYINGVLASPPRDLTLRDFMAGLSVITLYVLWYFLFLDRVGVHMYPIFSPRTHFLSVVWLLTILAYTAGFYAWRAVVAR